MHGAAGAGGATFRLTVRVCQPLNLFVLMYHLAYSGMECLTAALLAALCDNPRAAALLLMTAFRLVRASTCH
jgi:hypothetical protein